MLFDRDITTNGLLYYLALGILIWLLTWYIVYLISGFHLKTITINNGISFNGVSFQTKRFNVKIRSLRFRLWGNTKMTIVDDLTIKLYTKSKESTTPPPSPSSSQPKQQSETPDFDTSHICVYSRNKLVRITTSFLIKHFPTLDLELRNTSITSAFGYETKIHYIKTNITSRNSKRHLNKVKFKTGLFVNEVTHQIQAKQVLLTPFQLRAFRVDIGFSINTITGFLDSLIGKVNISDSNVSVFSGIKYYVLYDELKHEHNTNRNTNWHESGSDSDSDSESKSESVPETENNERKAKERNKKRKLHTLDRTLKILYHLITDITIHIEGSKISEIPFVLIDDNLSISDYYNEPRPRTSLELCTKAITFNIARIDEDAAGFEVLFDPTTDSPFHWTSSIQLIKLFFVRRVELSTGHFGHESDEVLNVPNFSFTHKTNLLGQLVKAKGFKNCVMEVYFSASTPIFDIDAKQLSAILYNIVLLKKWMKLRKLRRALNNQQQGDVVESSDTTKIDSGEDDEDDDEDDVVDDDDNDYEGEDARNRKGDTEVEPLKAKMWRYLNEYYPRLDVKLVIEQPRIVLRHYEPGKHTQLLSFSYSLLNFNLSTTDSRDYSSTLEVLHPSILYQEKSSLDAKEFNNEIIKKRIAHLSYLNIKLDIFKNLTIKAAVELHKISVNLTSLDIFRGIHWLLSDITKLTETDLQIGVINRAFNKEINLIRINSRYSELRKQHLSNVEQTTLEDKLFCYLPSWLAQLDIAMDSVDILIGARSVLIPTDQLFHSDSPALEYDTDVNKDLRKLNLKLGFLSTRILNHQLLSTPTKQSFYRTNSPTSSETLTSVQDTSFWSVTTKVDMLQVLMPDDNSTKHSSTDPFITFPQIEMSIESIRKFREINQLLVNTKVDKVQLNFNLFKLFTIIGSIYLIREFIISPIKLIKTKVRKDLHQFQDSVSSIQSSQFRSRSSPPKSTIDFLTCKFKLDTVDFVFKLQDEFKLKLQVSDIQMELQNRTAKLSLFFIRLLANSPTVENKWCRLLCLDSLELGSQIPNSISDLKIDIHTDAIRLIQPHKFVVYKLFDNISLTIKSAKHLIRLLKAGNDKEGASVVHPHEQKPISLPKLNIHSRHLKFAMEDDPFETELNMIYQLGKVEQRKRLELYDLFDAKEKSLRDDKHYFSKLNRLHETMANSWIRKVRVYKLQLRREVVAHKIYLFGNETRFDSDYNSDVVAYPFHAPLLTIGMEDFNLKLRRPKFELEKVSSFIHNVGQGVPKDTPYSLLIPTYLKLRVAEMRMQLRDYPLPILHSPRNKNPNNASLMMSGHLIITEVLVTAQENIRQLYVPLVPPKNGELNKFDALTIEKTLSSVKMYTSMKCDFNSDYPTRIVWGTSYEFGIQQFMLNFDQFSKPPVDPSMKLGFWDKLKYILHGSCTIKTRTSLEVGFKGSRDPYELLGSATGFVLSFKNNVVWKINKDDNSKNFFDITAEKASWYIPNYLGAPLLAWTRNSVDSIYLSDSDKFISSCFAYYLDESLSSSSPSSSTTKPDLDRLNNVFAKNTIGLNGGIKFRVGFLLQRKVDGKRVDDFKPHYNVQLMNPKFCEEGHDSYAGFRSEYIHMAISLTADRENAYNAIHLSPGAFTQFFAWWKLFASNMMLPIRKGPLFGESKKKVKFSQHLFTNKFSFFLKSLFISHIYRDEIVDVEEDRIECVGLRAKMDEFSVDLHQRKEPVTLYHEELSKETKVMKMVFNVGEVVLSKIDMRVVRASFTQNFYSQNTKNVDKNDKEKKSKYNIFGNDRQWFDIQDYEEPFLPSVKNCGRVIDIYPLMFSHWFSYERDTEKDASKNQDDDEYGNEDIHDCRLKSKDPTDVQVEDLSKRLKNLEEQIAKVRKTGKSTFDLEERIKFIKKEIGKVSNGDRVSYQRASTASSLLEKNEHFHNKFTWLSMLLKWNVTCRNLVMKYIHFVQLRASLRKYLSHESIAMLDKIIDHTNEALESDDLSSCAKTLKRVIDEGNDDDTSLETDSRAKQMSSKEKLVSFDKILKKVNKGETLSEDYLISVIAPQIQLQSNESPDSVVLISAPAINSKIVSVLDLKDAARAETLETRYGSILKNANVFILDKQDVLESSRYITVRHPYGADSSNWPPWLGTEVTQRGEWAGESHLLIKNMSVGVLFYNTEVLGGNISRMSGDTCSEARSAKSEIESAQVQAQADRMTPKRLIIDMPSIVLTSTSSQYFTLYVIVIDLLFYSEPMTKYIEDKIEKMKLSIDFESLGAVAEKVKQMQAYFHMLRWLTSNYSFRNGHLSNEKLNEYLQINLTSGDVASDVYLLLKTLFTGDFFDDVSKNPQIAWLIRADEFILHILEDDRTPILDLALANGEYERKELEGGSNINKLKIGMMQGFNLIKSAKFPDFISPFNMQKDKDLVDLDWTMNRSVGGIRILENIKVNSLPLSIKIDEITGEKLLRFIFQTDSIDIKNSKVMKVANSLESKKKKMEENLSDDGDEFGLIDQTEGINKSVDFDKLARQEQSTNSSKSNNKKKSLTNVGTPDRLGLDDEQSDEQVEQMVKRSKTYFSIISLLVKPITLQITVRLNKGLKRILNVSDFTLDLPELVIQNRIMSFNDLVNLMKKVIYKTLMGHLGSLLANKLKPHTVGSGESELGPLKQVKHYGKFIPVRELEATNSAST
ncbi:FMP27 [Candida oxycetoniae]|uniref:FMP27 n=1 Tax=Candida oxycetoniae TaxID=497107 RepID=A0AAI9WXG3_9ASCO|nr:FMP27 [Candida oxycetoniae]KAI3404212.2 FMP27 [Candida oxycetoniae]